MARLNVVVASHSSSSGGYSADCYLLSSTSVNIRACYKGKIHTCLTCFAISAAWSRSCSATSMLEVRAKANRHLIHLESLSMSWLSFCQPRLTICCNFVIFAVAWVSVRFSSLQRKLHTFTWRFRSKGNVGQDAI